MTNKCAKLNCPYCKALKSDHKATCDNIECVNKELTLDELSEPSLSRGISVHDVLNRPGHKRY